MRFVRVPLLILISYFLLLHLRFCKTYQNCSDHSVPHGRGTSYTESQLSLEAFISNRAEPKDMSFFHQFFETAGLYRNKTTGKVWNIIHLAIQGTKVRKILIGITKCQSCSNFALKITKKKRFFLVFWNKKLNSDKKYKIPTNKVIWNAFYDKFGRHWRKKNIWSCNLLIAQLIDLMKKRNLNVEWMIFLPYKKHGWKIEKNGKTAFFWTNNTDFLQQGRRNFFVQREKKANLVIA